jgi:EAL and modified HD-GYP domain-containing signal transduction protein
MRRRAPAAARDAPGRPVSGAPWWSRLLGRGQAAKAAKAVRPGAPPDSPAVPAPGAGAGSDDNAAPPAGSLRRPLVGRDGQVGAFEWLLTDAASRTLGERQAQWAAAAAAGLPGLVALGLHEAQEPALQAALPRGLWLVLDGLPTLPLAAELRNRGLRVGAPALAPVAEPALDFVVVTAAGGGLDTLLLAEQRWREQQPRVQAVALGLTSLDDAEQLLARGFHLAGGRLARARAAPGAQALGAAAHRICELLSRLAQDDDTAAVAAAVRADVALGYRLLRYANSPSIGLRTPAETVEQAVTVLGRRELTRWLQVMLLSAAASRPAQQALQQHTLMRARLLECLAERRGEPEPGAFFTLGLLSTLEQLLNVPLATAIAPLRLREEAQQALLQGRGPWAGQLALLDAIEAPDEALAWQAAEALGQAHELAPVAEEAWAWASGLHVG